LDLFGCGFTGITMRHDAGHIVDLRDVAIITWNFAVPDADFVIFDGRFHERV
jgi:hypothetical protein